MRIRQTISKVDGGKRRVDVVKTYLFSKSDLTFYIETFELLKLNNYIEAGTFQDVHWYLPCDQKLRNYRVSFDIEIYGELNIVLKGYVAIRRLAGLTPASCYIHILRLKTLIIYSEGLENVEKIESFFAKSTPEKAWEYARILKNFLEFYPHNKANQIEQICGNIPRAKHSNRDLPHFIDVLKFNEVIEEVFETEAQEVILPYYPILIWWRLTNIIPMRPVDFFELSYDCVELKGNGTYWINFKRSKNLSHSPNTISRPEEIQIDKDMYFLIMQFKNILNELSIDTQYLIPYSFLNMFNKVDHSQQRKIQSSRIGDTQFERLLQKFYKNILMPRYGHIDKITAGDTRHFAIINLFLQGFNALTIARMAGHEKLESQSSYYSHAVHYAQSYVYHLAQGIFEKNISAKFSEGLFGSRREAIDRGRIYNTEEVKSFKNIDYGYCSDISDNFPSNCIEDCRSCDFYIFKPSINEYNEGIKWLEDYSQKLDLETKKTIKFMQHLSEEMLYDISTLSYQPSYQQKLSSNAANLFSLIDQRAIVEAKLLEVRANEKQ